MRTKLLVVFVVLLSLVCVVFAPLPGRAAAISDALIVYNPVGTIVQMVTATESQETGGNQIFFIGVPSLADPAGYGHATTLCEAGVSPCDSTTPFTSLSDIVGVIKASIGTSTFYYLGFASDAENGIAPGTEAAFGGLGTNFLVEPVAPINVTMYLSPSLRSAGYTATFQSEFPTPPIPEPGTLVLVGTGLIGLAASLAHRRKSR